MAGKHLVVPDEHEFVDVIGIGLEVIDGRGDAIQVDGVGVEHQHVPQAGIAAERERVLTLQRCRYGHRARRRYAKLMVFVDHPLV